jgi:hypothetical protein
MKCKRHIPVCPALSDCPEPQPEPLIFSSIDFQLFRCAFQNMKPEMPFFDSIKMETIERFTPFLLEFFPSYPPSTILSKPIISLPCPQLNDPEPDKVFEQAIAQQLHLTNSNFQEYSLTRSIIEAQRKMADLEDFIRFQFCRQILRNEQKSILRFRNFCVGRYCRILFEMLNLHSQPIDAIAASFLRTSCDFRRLMEPFLAALLNFAKVQTPPDGITRLFAVLRAQYAEIAWSSIVQIKGLKRIIELMPEPTRRKLENFGDIFVLFSKVFERTRQICEYFKTSVAEYKSVVKFIALNSEFREILKVYLVCDKVVFQREVFTSCFKTELTRDWNTFFAIMWEMIAVNEQLMCGVSKFQPI